MVEFRFSSTAKQRSVNYSSITDTVAAMCDVILERLVGSEVGVERGLRGEKAQRHYSEDNLLDFTHERECVCVLERAETLLGKRLA